MEKQKKTASEFEEIVKPRIGAGDFPVTIHSNPETPGGVAPRVSHPPIPAPKPEEDVPLTPAKAALAVSPPGRPMAPPPVSAWGVLRFGQSRRVTAFVKIPGYR